MFRKLPFGVRKEIRGIFMKQRTKVKHLKKISKKYGNEFIFSIFVLSQGNKAALVQLLKSDVDVNFRCSFGSTPLHAASKHGKFENLQFLR